MSDDKELFRVGTTFSGCYVESGILSGGVDGSDEIELDDSSDLTSSTISFSFFVIEVGLLFSFSC